VFVTARLPAVASAVRVAVPPESAIFLRIEPVANLNQPDDEVGKLPIAEPVPAAIGAKGAARRRFAKAGMGASGGVLLTLASQPAMATLVCTSPSGACSSNLSKHNTSAACTGVGPDYWKKNHSAWKGAGTNGGALYRLTFPTTSRCAALNPYTCFDIVDPNKVANGADQDKVAMHIMATILNVRSKRIGFLNESQVLAIWNSYAATGTYKATSTVTWNGYQIVAYLKSTMS
jgi:hypothetical protein